MSELLPGLVLALVIGLTLLLLPRLEERPRRDESRPTEEIHVRRDS